MINNELTDKTRTYVFCIFQQNCSAISYLRIALYMPCAREHKTAAAAAEIFQNLNFIVTSRYFDLKSSEEGCMRLI